LPIAIPGIYKDSDARLREGEKKSLEAQIVEVIEIKVRYYEVVNTTNYVEDGEIEIGIDTSVLIKHITQRIGSSTVQIRREGTIGHSVLKSHSGAKSNPLRLHPEQPLNVTKRVTPQKKKAVKSKFPIATVAQIA
jgi:hypothetical protein